MKIPVQYIDQEAEFAPKTSSGTEPDRANDGARTIRVQRLVTAYQWLGLTAGDAQEAARADAELFATETQRLEGVAA